MLSFAVVLALIATAAATGNSNSNSNSNPLNETVFLNRCVVSSQQSTTNNLVTVAVGKYPAGLSYSLTGRWCGNVQCFAAAACVAGKSCYALLPGCSSRTGCTSVSLISCDGLPNSFDGNGDGKPDILQPNVISVSVNGGGVSRRDVGDSADATKAVPATITVQAAANVRITSGSWTNLVKFKIDGVQRLAPFGGVKFSATNVAGAQTYKFFFKPIGSQTICTTHFDVVARKANGQFKDITAKTKFTQAPNKFCVFTVRMDDNSPLDQDPATNFFTGEVFLLNPLANGSSTTSTTKSTTTTTTPTTTTTTTTTSSSSSTTTTTDVTSTTDATTTSDATTTA